MNKFYLTICFCLSFLFFFSCERPDLTEDVEWVYDHAKCNTIDGNMWSPGFLDYVTWDVAVSLCDNMTACGYSDWKLPTISELRTLIKNCSATETSGSCGVTDSCLSYNDCRNDACGGCEYDESGGHSKLGDTGWFWSSSVRSGSSNSAWGVNFNGGYVGNSLKNDYKYVRCVR